MAQSILETAADVRQAKAKLDEVCADLRRAGGEWTDHSLAGEDALSIAATGLHTALTMLRRLESMAQAELRRLTPEAEA